jgi:hypothetical protein
MARLLPTAVLEDPSTGIQSTSARGTIFSPVSDNKSISLNGFEARVGESYWQWAWDAVKMITRMAATNPIRHIFRPILQLSQRKRDWKTSPLLCSLNKSVIAGGMEGAISGLSAPCVFHSVPADARTRFLLMHGQRNPIINNDLSYLVGTEPTKLYHFLQIKREIGVS